MGGWRARTRMVFEDSGLAASPYSPVARFFFLVACFLHGRLHHRPGGQGKVLEGSEGAGTVGEGCRCSGRATGVESRCVRPHVSSCGRGGRSKGWPADQRDSCGDRGTSRSAAAFRYHGRARSGSRREPPASGDHRLCSSSLPVDCVSSREGVFAAQLLAPEPDIPVHFNLPSAASVNATNAGSCFSDANTASTRASIISLLRTAS